MSRLYSDDELRALDGDERLARAVQDAQHTAMVEAGRTDVYGVGAAYREGHDRGYRLGRAASGDADNDALRAAVARLEAEAEQAYELLAEYAARTAQADELVRLLQRIGVLEDGTDDDRWRAIPLHGRVAELCGEYETTYLGGPEVHDGE